MDLKTRKRWSLLILLVGLPLYIAVSVSLVAFAERIFGRLPFLLELAVYILLGVLWAFPLKSVFLGVGQADPNEQDDADDAQR